jgi:hypothetical protein
MTQMYNAGEAFTATEARSDTGTLFGSTMALIAVTTGLFTLGAYLGRNLSGGWALAFWIASFVCLMAMNVTIRHSARLTLGMLFGFGFLVGLSTAPTISYFANVYPEAVWEAGGATALFVAGLGTSSTSFNPFSRCSAGRAVDGWTDRRTWPSTSHTLQEVAMTSNARPSDALQDAVTTGARRLPVV